MPGIDLGHVELVMGVPDARGKRRIGEGEGGGVAGGEEGGEGKGSEEKDKNNNSGLDEEGSPQIEERKGRVESIRSAEPTGEQIRACQPRCLPLILLSPTLARPASTVVYFFSIP